MNKQSQITGGSRNVAVQREWSRDLRARILNALRESSDTADLMKEYRLYRTRSVSAQTPKILQILQSLGSARVSDLAAKCRMTPHIVSAHLVRLVEAGLIQLKTEDGERRYFVRDQILASALDLLNNPKDWRPPTESQLIDSLIIDYPDLTAAAVAARS